MSDDLVLGDVKLAMVHNNAIQLSAELGVTGTYKEFYLDILKENLTAGRIYTLKIMLHTDVSVWNNT